MVYENDVKQIVMVTNLTEKGKVNVKYTKNFNQSLIFTNRLFSLPRVNAINITLKN